MTTANDSESKTLEMILIQWQIGYVTWVFADLDGLFDVDWHRLSDCYNL